MSRKEFLDQLAYLLQDIAPEERDDAIGYYVDYFEEAGPEREQQVIEELGSPEKVAAMIRDSLNGTTGEEEYTENGISFQRKPGPESHSYCVDRCGHGGARSSSDRCDRRNSRRNCRYIFRVHIRGCRNQCGAPGRRLRCIRRRNRKDVHTASHRIYNVRRRFDHDGSGTLV